MSQNITHEQMQQLAAVFPGKYVFVFVQERGQPNGSVAATVVAPGDMETTAYLLNRIRPNAKAVSEAAQNIETYKLPKQPNDRN